VFESFNRLGVNQAKIEGTGIGLAISRKLALLMGGRVGFVSKPGEGSVFWLELQEAAEGSNGRLSKA
jgi:signal transduction histidine kinase